jgi:glycosyltransferase involved in cell wall biosynthesis
MRIVIVSDACDPPTNGVSRTVSSMHAWLERLGHTVALIEPNQFRTVPCPTDPEIRLAVFPARGMARILDFFKPDAVLLATEGPLGITARAYCLRRGRPFLSMFTTKFPEAIHARIRVPVGWTYALMRWFHRPSRALLAATPSLCAELRARGFTNVTLWSRGVDTELFRPRSKSFLDLPRPIHLYVGRVAVEKTLEDFLALDLPGSKLVVGDGAELPSLQAKYPEVHFVGVKRGAELARYYAASDVFVFPSRTDTFGLVLLEALACGIPVAAYPVTGPRDIIGDSGAGVLDWDLGHAARAALGISPELCRERALVFSWEACAKQLAALLQTHCSPPGRKRLKAAKPLNVWAAGSR